MTSRDESNLDAGRLQGFTRRESIILTVLATAGIAGVQELIRSSPANAAPTWFHPFTSRALISSYYDEYDPNYWASTNHYHKGLDYIPGAGVKIYSCAAGSVEDYGYGGGWGNWILLNHGDGYKTRYAHMLNAPLITSGTYGASKHLGYVGATEVVSAHLHLELIYNGSRIDPYNYVHNAALAGSPSSSATNRSGDNDMLMLTKASAGPTFDYALFGPGFWYEWNAAPTPLANGLLAQIAGNTSTGGAVVTTTEWNAIKAAALRTQSVQVVP